MITNKSVVALTSGDPASISPIITLKAWLELKLSTYCFFLIADIDHLANIIKKFNLDIPLEEINYPSECTRELFSKKLPVLHIKNKNLPVLGLEDKKNSEFILNTINKAVDLANNKLIHGIVTNPINKSLINSYGIKDFYGHTDYIFHLSKLKTNNFPIMLLSSIKENVHVVPLTTHIPLADVPNQITKDKIISHTLSLQEYFINHYNITKPTIHILGLNPHAGESGILGKEEINIITPAIKTLQNMNVNVTGPESADTIFNTKNRIILGMYHDQVLAPFKALYFNSGVNTTLNLGFIRTSPDHGTAFDLLKNSNNIKKIASSSLVSAIKAAFISQNNNN